MKNLRLKLAAAALVLGFGSAMATSHHAFANRVWAKDPLTGLYSDVTGQDYDCTPGTTVCTQEYPAGVDANHPGSVQPSNIILGTFSQ